MATIASKTGADFSGLNAIMSECGTIGTVAAAGSSNTDATVPTADSNYVTGADGTKGVILYDTEVGGIIRVFNFTAQILKVYPPATHQLNNLTATTVAVSIAASKGGSFHKLTNNQWGVIYA